MPQSYDLQAQHPAESQPAGAVLSSSECAELQRLAQAQALQLQRTALERAGGRGSADTAAWEAGARSLASASARLADLQTTALVQARALLYCQVAQLASS